MGNRERQEWWWWSSNSQHKPMHSSHSPCCSSSLWFISSSPHLLGSPFSHHEWLFKFDLCALCLCSPSSPCGNCFSSFSSLNTRASLDYYYTRGLPFSGKSWCGCSSEEWDLGSEHLRTLLSEVSRSFFFSSLNM